MNSKQLICSLFSLLVISLTTNNIQAQVTIGTDDVPASGMLLQLKNMKGVTSQKINADKGFGAPKVELQDIAMLEPCAVTDADNKAKYKGLAVYNTVTTATLVPGGYIWDGNKWLSMGGEKDISLSAWYKIGAGIPTFINTDNVYLSAKVVVGGKDIVNDAMLTVTGDTEVAGMLDHNGKAVLGGDLYVKSDVTWEEGDVQTGTLQVGTSSQAKAVELNGTLDVTGTSQIGGATKMNNTLVVDETTTISNNVTVYNNTTVGAPATASNIQTNGYIRVSDNLMVGTTTPIATLTVGGLGYSAGGYYFGRSVQAPATLTYNYGGMMWNSVRSGWGEIDLVNDRGSGGGGFRFFSYPGARAPISDDWVAYINSAGVYTAKSDRRIKTNIKSVDRGLAEVLKLRPVEYKLHTSNNFAGGEVVLGEESSDDIGFIAQEVETIFPIVVTKPASEESLYMMSYEKLIPFLTKAIQEQQTIIVLRTKEIEELEKQINALTNK